MVGLPGKNGAGKTLLIRIARMNDSKAWWTHGTKARQMSFSEAWRKSKQVRVYGSLAWVMIDRELKGWARNLRCAIPVY